MSDGIADELTGISGKSSCLVTGSGTAAIYVALRASGIPLGGGIALPDIACPDPALAVIWAGYKPVFVDVALEDYNMDPNSLRQIVEGGRVEGVIAVHLFGNACQIAEISAIAKRAGIFLLEDCAQGMGNRIAEGKLGSFGDASVFSFGKGKILSVGHGGCVNTSDERLYSKMLEIESNMPRFDPGRAEFLGKWHRKLYYGIRKISAFHRSLEATNKMYSWLFKDYYLHRFNPGAIGSLIKGLQGLPGNLASREAIYRRYQSGIRNPKVALPIVRNLAPSLSRYTVVTDKATELSERIRRSGIHSNDMYPPLESRFYVRLGSRSERNSQKLRGRMLNLWTNEINDDQIENSIEILNGIEN